MARLDLKKKLQPDKSRVKSQKAVPWSCCTFEDKGKRFFQLDTYGTDDRNKNYINQLSQSIRLDEISASCIMNEIIKAFPKLGESNGVAIKYTPLKDIKYPYNRIIFGAPGTGKSFKLQEDINACIKVHGGEYERVTFHPDYTYSQFVGAYKPVSKDGTIEYKFVPGPFLRVYVEAMKSVITDKPKPYILLIEEINRARVAAVFGDVFQLLDRGGNGVSTYPIHTSEDIRNYLAGELGGSPEDYKEMRLPNNMFIWATMNSADQGVFPMDTAFKRRWSFEYISINDAETAANGYVIQLGDKAHIKRYKWNEVRHAINDTLTACGINEDKLLGPFFMSEETLKHADDDENSFNDSFKSKVIMYLFEDVMKMRPGKLFNAATEKAPIYSDICDDFDTIGLDIFKFDKSPIPTDTTN